MSFFEIFYSEEYSKERGQFDLVDGINFKSRFTIKDGEKIENDLFENCYFEYLENSNIILADFQMAYPCWRIISETFYNVIFPFSNSDIVYHPINVVVDNKKHGYYIMHFENKIDVINKNLSQYAGETIWKPVIDAKRTGAIPDIFKYNESKGEPFCVSNRLKNIIDSQNITGIDYRVIPVK